MLLAQRRGDALASGHVHRAPGVLTEQKLQLGGSTEDRIRREVCHELRERILTEPTADRASSELWLR